MVGWIPRSSTVAAAHSGAWVDSSGFPGFRYAAVAAPLHPGLQSVVPYSIRVPKDSKKDLEIVVAAFLSFLLLFSFFQRPVHSVEIWVDDGGSPSTTAGLL